MKAEKIILLFYFAINIAQFLIVNLTGIYISDALGESMNASEASQVGILAASLASCVLGYAFYKAVIKKRINPQLHHDEHLRQALIVGLIMTFTGCFLFDYGRAETQSTLSFGFIFRLIPTDLLFAYYFCIIPLNKAKSYVLVLAYLALKVWMGWTGMFMGIFWTLFIRIVNANQHRRWIGPAALGLLLLAFALAPMVYSMKFYLRWGVYEFAYFDALARLVGRIGFYSNSLYLWENASQFATAAANNLPAFSYIKDGIVAVLPRSLLGLQGENMETEFVNFVVGDYGQGVTFYLGLLGKSIVYAHMYIFDLPLMLFITTGLIYLIIRFDRAIIGSRSNPMIIMGIFQALLSGSIEEISYGVYAAIVVYLICSIRWSPRRRCPAAAYQTNPAFSVY